jgi:putative hemolysin
MFDFEIKIASSKEEIQQALRLRYEVFKLEMGSDLSTKDISELETDIYDKFCDHLIVIDKTINKVVGTYRFILGSRVDKKIGFYSERFFDIRNIKKLASGDEVLELGRSCIHKDYRSRPVINLLWSGIAKYVKDHNVKYLFGSVRFLTQDPTEISKIFKFIKERYYSGPKFRVYPKPENKFKGLRENVEIKNPQEIIRNLPPLVKGYLRAGVVVCGEPALNLDLGSVVIFILLDPQKMPSAYKQHYL